MAVGHGGGCCGINHSAGYDLYTAEQVRQKIHRDKRQTLSGMLLEVVVTDPQLRYFAGFASILTEEGFKLVTRFRNPNSGNMVNVFHFTESRASIDPKDLPFSLDPVPVDKPAAPAPVQGEAGGWRRLGRFEPFNNRSVLRVNNPRLVTHGWTLNPGQYWTEGQYVHCGNHTYRKDNLEIQVR